MLCQGLELAAVPVRLRVVRGDAPFVEGKAQVGSDEVRIELQGHAEPEHSGRRRRDC